ncbi:MAG: transposase [Actinomycetia bacterium]|nr:transposase [Actinomycetes bacterium]
MSEEQLRREAVRRRSEGQGPSEIAEALGRSTRWVRKWVARHDAESDNDGWAQSRSRAPKTSPTKTSDSIEAQILAARERLVANPRAQYGSLAIQWDLRRVGVDPIPPARTIERVLARHGVVQPRRRASEQYRSKNVPYPTLNPAEPGTTHQVDMIGPRHLFGAAKFHTMNLIDVGSHRVGNVIVTETRPGVLVKALTGIWSRVGIPSVAQFDNHANFRGGIPPAWRHFSPIVAACLDLDITPRFIPVREPWRNGVIEHFNDVWDKSFFRTEVFTSLEHLRTENAAFVEFHNAHHRYSAHQGATPNQMWHNRLHAPLPAGYQPPRRLPAKGRIEVVRYIRSNRKLGLFGKTITLAHTDTYQYVTAIIKVRSRKLIVIDINGEIIHNCDFDLSRELR